MRILIALSLFLCLCPTVNSQTASSHEPNAGSYQDVRDQVAEALLIIEQVRAEARGGAPVDGAESRVQEALRNRAAKILDDQRLLATIRGRELSSGEIEGAIDWTRENSASPELLARIEARLQDDPIRLRRGLFIPALVRRELLRIHAASPQAETSIHEWIESGHTVLPITEIAPPLPAPERSQQQTSSLIDASAVCEHVGWRSGGLLSGLDTATGVGGWTGSELVVMGEGTAPWFYDPTTDTWRFGRGLGAQDPFEGAFSIVAGGKLIVVGGYKGYSGFTNGWVGHLDLSGGAWTFADRIFVQDPPIGRHQSAGVDTGTEVLIHGGMIDLGGINCTDRISLDSMDRFDLSTETWTVGPVAPIPPRQNHAAVWTGTEMIIWGGHEFRDDTGIRTEHADGAAFNPTTNSWRVLSASPLTGRSDHAAVWTGSEMVIWGGASASTTFGDGAAYDPVSDTWRTLSSVDAPNPSPEVTAVWTGSLVLFRGLGASGRYDPVADSWSSMSAPTPTTLADVTSFSVWLGSLALYADGRNSGGLYDPVTDSWTETRSGFQRASPRINPLSASVFTGAELLAWSNGRGQKFDLATATWSPISTSNEPADRLSIKAVWTGNEMIIWGGVDLGGGRYDPALDSWTAMSRAGEPTVDQFCCMGTWTGTEYVVWNGTGARYSPSTDSWTPITSVGAPPPFGASRYTIEAVDGQVFMFGHNEGSCLVEARYGLYDPQTDTWPSIDTGLFFTSREGQAAAVVPPRVYMWGGLNRANFDGTACDEQSFYLSTLLTYDVSTDEWNSQNLGTAAEDANLTADGNGGLVLQGGTSRARGLPPCGWQRETLHRQFLRVDLGSGGAVEAFAEAAPFDATRAVSFWTGSEQLVYNWYTGTGGLYSSVRTQDPDNDSDGFGDCLDCDDGDPRFYPGAPETCNSEDRNCNGINQDGTDTDDDLDGYTECDGDCQDFDPNVNPDSFDFCDGIDNDCDGTIDEGLGIDDDADMRDACDDCDDSNPGVWGFPGDVDQLVVSNQGQTLIVWTNMAAAWGPIVQYDLAGGDLSDLTGSGSYAATSCLLPSFPQSQWVDTRPDPPPGDGYFYRVRGKNPCGIGTFGTAKADAEITSCPTPP